VIGLASNVSRLEGRRFGEELAARLDVEFDPSAEALSSLAATTGAARRRPQAALGLVPVSAFGRGLQPRRQRVRQAARRRAGRRLNRPERRG
jgi:hypothetical protein